MAALPDALGALSLLNAQGRLYALGGVNATLYNVNSNYQYTPADWSAPISTFTVQTATGNGTIALPFTGYVSASQISNALFISNQSSGAAVLSFNFTGAKGDSGFGNVTVPKSAVPDGTAPMVYVDGEQAAQTSLTADADNFYVWFSMHFSSHTVSIEFPAPTPTPTPTTSSPTPTPSPSIPEFPAWIALAVFAMAASTIAVAALPSERKRGQNNKQ